MPPKEVIPDETMVPPNPLAVPTLTKELSLGLEALAEQTQKRVANLFALMLAGRLTVDQFVDAAADVIVGANLNAMANAQMSWDMLMGLLGIDIESVPHDSRDLYLDVDRLSQAIETSLDDDDTAETRILRVAQAEPKEAGQRRYSENVAGHSKTEGWVREMDSNPCTLCQWWSREGRVWPKHHALQTHKGCACMARPVFVAGRISGVSDVAYAASEARKRFGDTNTRRTVDPAAYTTHKSRAKRK